MAEYEPGVCNIGAGEQRRRYALGAVSFAATLGLLFAIYAANLPKTLALATFLPLFGAAEGYYQGRYQFCAGYALLGVYNVADEGGDRTPVTDPDARRADRRRALRIHAYAGGTALLGASLVHGVGLLIL
ncbi:hypothetical protein [Halobaculum gomorrense]|uniref:Uncharacterized protein n=1 Tax=Halobaculum gomorrense TaxID=43928 RepID=A0A1M5RZ32_9EURY|nr:hypothetical protein [Halobaculum gomorrense]SHH31434.1 hypothetical protein SAMN05443636_2278 [Halobaculum gomorrense]